MVRRSHPVGGGASFSAPALTGLRFCPAFYAMRTGSFAEIKKLGRGVNHPLHLALSLKKGVELYLYYSYGPSWYVIGWNLPVNRFSQNQGFRTQHKAYFDIEYALSYTYIIIITLYYTFLNNLLLKYRFSINQCLVCVI